MPDNNQQNNHQNNPNNNQQNNQQNNQNNNQQNNNNNNNQQNNVNGLAPHEMLELHELINIGVVGAKKTKASMEMVQDAELKTFMKDSLNGKKLSLEQMQTFISNQPNLQ